MPWKTATEVDFEVLQDCAVIHKAEQWRVFFEQGWVLLNQAPRKCSRSGFAST